MLDSESKKKLIERTKAARRHGKGELEHDNGTIPARTQVGEALRQNEQLYHTIFEGSRDAIFITGEDSRFVEVNEAASVLTGYSREELKRMAIPDLHEEKDLEAYRQFFHRIMSGEQVTSDAKILRKDGTKVVTEFSNRRIEIAGVPYMHTVARDISERREIEEALRYRVEFEDIITDVSTNLVGRASDEIDLAISDALRAIGEFAEVDRSYVFLFSDHDTKMDNTHEWCAEGIQPQKENLQGLPLGAAPWWVEKLKSSEYIHIPRVADLPVEAIAERELLQFQGIQSVVVVPMACGGNLMGFLGFDSVRKERVWLADIIALLRIVGEVFANALTRKQTQEELLFETALLEAQSEASIDGILVVNDQGNVVSFNERMREMWRVPHETWNTGDDAKLLEHAFTQLQAPEEFFEKVKYLYAHKEEKSRDEIVLKDGRYFDRYSCPLADSDGRYQGRIWFFRDITDRKKAEEALHDSEQRLRALSEASFEAIFLSETGVCLDQNRAAEEMFGYTRAEAVGRHGTEWIAPEDRERVKDKMLSGYEEPYEVSALRRDGTTFPCEIQARMIAYRGRSVRVTALRDITDRKRAERALQEAHDKLEKRVVDRTAELARANSLLEQKIARVIQTETALRESEQKLRNIIEHSRELFYLRDTNHQLTYVSPQSEDMLGYTPEEMMVKWTSMTTDNPINEEGLRLTEAAIATGRKQKPYSLELRGKNGKTVLVEVAESPIKDESGNVVAITGAITDVTDRKAAEERAHQR